MSHKKTRLLAKNYGLEAVENYKKFVPNSSSIQADLEEINNQLLMAGYEMDPPQAYWAWLNFSMEANGSWLPVTTYLVVPELIIPKFVTVDTSSLG